MTQFRFDPSKTSISEDRARLAAETADPFETSKRALVAEGLATVESLKADVEELRTHLIKARREVVRLREEVAELRVIRDDAEKFVKLVRAALPIPSHLLPLPTPPALRQPPEETPR